MPTVVGQITKGASFDGIVGGVDIAVAANNVLIGNIAGTVQPSQELNVTEVTAMLNIFSSTLKGLTPLSGGGTTKFLRADATWVVPAGGGTVDTSGTPIALDFARFTDADTIEGRSPSETRGDLGLVIGTDVLAEQAIGIADNNLVEIDSVDVASGRYAKFTVNGLDGRTTSEVLSDIGGAASAHSHADSEIDSLPLAGGDVTTSGAVATIGANKVTLGKMATLANSVLIGNVSGNGQDPAALTKPTVLTLLGGTIGSGVLVLQDGPTLRGSNGIDVLTIVDTATSDGIAFLQSKAGGGYQFLIVADSPPDQGFDFVMAGTGKLMVGSVDVVLVSGTQTLAGKILTTPTIASFVNAQHNHSAAGASGGTIAITDLTGTLAIGSGGTGQTTAQTAINILSAVAAATNEHVLTKDTGTGNATWKVAAGAGSGDVTAAASMGDNFIIRGDGGVKGVQDTGIEIDDLDWMTMPGSSKILFRSLLTAAIWSGTSTSLNVFGDTLLDLNCSQGGTILIGNTPNSQTDIGNNDTTNDHIEVGGSFKVSLRPQTSGNVDLGGSSNYFYDLYLENTLYLEEGLSTTAMIFSTGAGEGCIIGQAAAKLSFYGQTPDTQPIALTAAETTITNAGTASDYTIQTSVNAGWGAATQAEFETLVEVILNNQKRIGELETKLQALGLIA